MRPLCCEKRAGALGDDDIWYETQWRDATAAWDKDWTYSVSFHDGSDASATAGERVLVLDGVKMGAEIRLNGVTLGVVTDSFLRYVFPVSAHLRQAANNTLELVFDRSIDTNGRFMGCSG